MSGITVYQATPRRRPSGTRRAAGPGRPGIRDGEIEDRLRNHPNQLDITDGDALNVLLEALLNPATADRSLQTIKTPIRHESIRDIPFEYASECMTVCLDRMTMDGQWPLALRAEAFRPEREALRKAIVRRARGGQGGGPRPRHDPGRPDGDRQAPGSSSTVSSHRTARLHPGSRRRSRR